jgi:hydrogenase maturation protease
MMRPPQHNPPWRPGRSGGGAAGVEFLPTTLILAVGNTLLGDEGAGVHTARRLGELVGDRPGIEVLDGGTLSFTLLPRLEVHDRLIVLDAARLGAAPGAVQCFESSGMDAFLGQPRRSAHEVGLCDLMDMARLAGHLPGHRALIGIQPGQVEWSDTPSEAVSAALDNAARMALELLDRWDAGEAG